MEFTSDILKSIEKKYHTISVFLDLSKAFDTIHHSTLLDKLHFYGIRGMALEWFRSYLNNRKQFVTYKNFTSKSLDITCGVPQGSVLGPLLFIIYTNDLPNILKHSHAILFADDTTIYHSGTDPNYILNCIHKDLSALTEWLRANKLSLNILKTNFMVFSGNQIKPNNISLKIDNQEISQVPVFKFLGVKIDENLNWQDHILYCKSKLSGGLYTLSASKQFLPHSVLKTIYYSLINSYLN